MIFLYGDSHANSSFKGLTLSHKNYYESSITMFRIGRDNTIINFNNNEHDTNSVLCLVYGEIDCRCHIKRQVNEGRNENDVIKELVNAYFKTIENNLRLRKAVIVVGVTPSIRKMEYESKHGPVTHDFPFLGTDEERVRYTNKTNGLIKENCQKFGYIYFDPYDYYKRADGTLRYELSDSICHIGDNSHFLDRFKELYSKI